MQKYHIPKKWTEQLIFQEVQILALNIFYLNKLLKNKNVQNTATKLWFENRQGSSSLLNPWAKLRVDCDKAYL